MEMKTATPIKSNLLQNWNHYTMKAIIKHVFFLVAFGLSASATASQIVYHTTNPDNTSPLTGWTTDTKSGLQWLDVTDTAGLTYAQVESNPLYSGWSYATNTQLNQLIKDSTNITIQPLQNIQITNGSVYYPGNFSGLTIYNNQISSNTAVGFNYIHLLDPLINSLGSTLDTYVQETYGYPTYDSYFQATDPHNPSTTYNYYHNTYIDGLLAKDANGNEIGHIQSVAANVHIDSYGQRSDSLYDSAYYYTSYSAPVGGNLYGSFLVRDTAMIATPIPAAIWMVGSVLVGLIGFSRSKLQV